MPVTAKTVRDILQLALLGPGPQFGTGMIPADVIVDTTPKVGTPEAVEKIYVKRISGGRSDLTFKSYDSGVESYYGTRKDVIWLDEEAEQKIYSECLLRTLATVPGEPNGIILVTFTPLWGMTELAKEFIQAENGPKKLVTATWDDAPHLSKETRAELYKSAREAGIYEVWMRLSTGKLKVFRSCRNWLDEFRIFARDEKWQDHERAEIPPDGRNTLPVHGRNDYSLDYEAAAESP